MVNKSRDNVSILVKLLLLTMCCTSFLIFPSIQGTTPAYLLTFSMLITCLFINKRKSKMFYFDIVKFLFFYLFLTMLSQMALSFSGITSFHVSEATFIDSNDSSVLFRKSFFTQSLYLLVAIIFFYFTKNFYSKSWDKYFLTGAAFLSLYGLYEFVYFLFTHQNGDFISNRMFDGSHSGSLVQWFTIESFVVQRVKSLTGEPSMFALTIIPFFYYAFYTKRYKLSMLFGLAAVLTFSSTAYLGLAIFFVAKIIKFYKNIILLYCASLLCMILGLIVGFEKIWKIIYDAVFKKILTDSQSTVIRSFNFGRHMDFYSNLPFFNKLFGVGFGTVRSTDLFSTLLINVGIVGLIIFTFLFLYPVFKLKTLNNEIRAIKLSLIFVYIAMMIAVPEFSYLSSWLFLGVSYYYIKEAKASLLSTHLFCYFQANSYSSRYITSVLRF